jgi:hypothetical protein
MRFGLCRLCINEPFSFRTTTAKALSALAGKICRKMRAAGYKAGGPFRVVRLFLKKLIPVF